MNKPKVLALFGVALGLAICVVGFPMADMFYRCSGRSCPPTIPPQVIVGQDLLFGGAAVILISSVALGYSSKHPQAVSRVCYTVLAIGGVVLIAAELYSINPVILIPNVVLNGNVVFPASATSAQLTFVACTVESGPDLALRCNPKPNAQSYNATIHEGSYSISLPNGLSYNVTLTYRGTGYLHTCPSAFVTVMSYSPGMDLTGVLGC
jgi:hypothetical protein